MGIACSSRARETSSPWTSRKARPCPGKLGFESGDDRYPPALPEGVCVIGTQNLGIYSTDDGRRSASSTGTPGRHGTWSRAPGVSALTYALFEVVAFVIKELTVTWTEANWG